jgi:DNA-binding PadR family transcriptional regulator
VDAQPETPLTESTFFIMLSLAPGPKHGYAILKDVEALSERRVILSTGTLYGAIKRLLEQGWIERVEEATSDAAGRERKSYALTPQGRRVLNVEVARLQKLVRAAQLRPVGAAV